MVDHVVRRPTDEDIDHIVDNIREADIEELEALDGTTVRESLDRIEDIENTSHVWEVEGKVMCIFGVVPQPGPLSSGVIWMLATEDFHKYAKIFARGCQDVVSDMINGYSYLFNYIHSENKVSINWLKWLGFKVNDPIPVGHEGANFHKFEMTNV